MARAVRPPIDPDWLLTRVQQGEDGSLGELTAVIEPELKRLACGKLRREAAGHLLQTTALVNEALLRLIRGGVVQRAPNMKYLMVAASRAMRSILVDQGRRRKLERRPGQNDPSVLDQILDRAEAIGLPIPELHAALKELAEIDARRAQVIELRYFGGVTIQRTAEVLGISTSTVESDSRVALAWLRTRIQAMMS